MQLVYEFLITQTWWIYQPKAAWYTQTYHWMNLAEGTAWLIFSVLVMGRYFRNRNSSLELLYSLAFFTFGLTDFREAYILESWLILVKGLNLAILLYLRSLVIRRYYPQSQMY